jgi:hypothetical protein
MHQCIPLAFGFVIRQQQALDSAAARHAGAEQTRGKHLGVVDDEQVALAKKFRELGDARVFDPARILVKDEKFRRPALGRRGLRDESGRQIEREVGNVHCFLLGGSRQCNLGPHTAFA